MIFIIYFPFNHKENELLKGSYSLAKGGRGTLKVLNMKNDEMFFYQKQSITGLLIIQRFQY